MTPNQTYAIGLDYGTASVRALIVRCHDGHEVATSVWNYAHGEDGVVIDARDPLLARQHPQDYIDGLRASILSALAQAKNDPEFSPSKIVGIGVDTTGSTPMPVDANFTPLACLPQFDKNPNAMAWLWKDHTSYAEAAEITKKSDEGGFPYMEMVGGTYSSEWWWAKILHCARVAPEVFAAAVSWIELEDFVPAYLAGAKSPAEARRGVCAAGHKGLFNANWGGLPAKEFLATLDPRLADLRDRLYTEAFTADHEAGKLDSVLAAELGLPAGIAIAIGAFDCHMGAVASGVKPGTLVKVLGTSSCDLTVLEAPADGSSHFIPGMCGVVNGSVIPQMLGIEAGQSACGDLYNWFADHMCPDEFSKPDPHQGLSAAALKLHPGESGLLALDWNNGNRTVLVDQRLTGLLLGQTLHTTAPEIYRALIEATAFGALTIMRRMEEHGAKIDEVVNCGGISEKNALVMQVYADVCNRPMRISRSAQTCALGAAIFASVAGGAHANVAEAQAAMTGTKAKVFEPDPKAVAIYARLYKLYMALHDAFGGVNTASNMGMLMKDLLAIRDDARALYAS